MAGNYNFTVTRGSTFRRTITWTDSNGTAIDLTGYTASFVVTKRDDTAVFTLTDASGITLGGDAGTILLEKSADEIAALDLASYVYKLTLVSAGDIATVLLTGAFDITRD